MKLTQTTKNIMSVNVPVYDFQTQTRSTRTSTLAGFAATGELDTADALGKVFGRCEAGGSGESAQPSDEEIEKTRRRVNASEWCDPATPRMPSGISP